MFTVHVRRFIFSAESISGATFLHPSPKACAGKKAKGSLSEPKPQERGMFSADLVDSDEPERYPSAAVKCQFTSPAVPVNCQWSGIKHVHTS